MPGSNASVVNCIDGWRSWAKSFSGGWSKQARLQDQLQSSQAQLDQWMSEKAGQEAGLLEIRDRVSAIERESMAVQQRLTEVRLSLESIRGRRGYGTSDIARFTQRLDAAQQRALDLEEQVAGLVQAIEASREEQTRQETLCREWGARWTGSR